ncbi:hypothetical protein Hdeb2414_s0010g00339171 [Helianthus debilis subsp. tardiflorus]
MAFNIYSNTFFINRSLSSKSSKTQQATHHLSSSMASPKMGLKLLIDRKGSRVLFAEVPKEFVDFLFHIFFLPLGTLIEFLGSNQMVGCLGKLKDSIESFDEDCLQSGIKSEDIFNPKTAFNGDKFLLSYDHTSSDDQSGPSGASKAVYMCDNALCSRCEDDSCTSNVTLYANLKCPNPNCRDFMNVKRTVVTPNRVAEAMEGVKKKKVGYVKKGKTYMVMDDLVVKPVSTISSITLINKFDVKDLSQLEEKMVSFGKDEGLKLLAASLKTDKVLTTIFMH